MDLFSRTGEEAASGANPLDVFHAQLITRQRTEWRSLFSGFRRLRAVTYSSTVPAILAVADLFESVDITFGSERVLSREAAALENASAIMGYRFTDAVADEKALIEKFIRPLLSKGGQRLLERVRDGSLRFRILRKAPSHEKLYLLEGDATWRVIVGSANLSLTALSGRQKETFICFDGEEAFGAFSEYVSRDDAQGDTIDADLLIVERPDAKGEPSLGSAETPVDIPVVPAVRLLKAGVTIIEEPRRIQVVMPSAEALREAARLGANLQELSLDRDRDGKVVISASGFARAWRTLTSRPIQEAVTHVPNAIIDLDRQLVTLDSHPWHQLAAPVPRPEVQQDSALFSAYLDSFAHFYGAAQDVQRGYWALACWLFAAPLAPLLRAAIVRHDGSALRYPVFAVLYGRPDGGKTHFTRVLARAMFGVEQMIRGKDFTSTNALGFRSQLGAIPLIIDDVNRDRFTKYVPDLVKFDRDDEERYAPILISTNREVTAIAPDLRKRMIVCHIDGARPKGLSVVAAQKALSTIGTALFRDFLNRLTPEVPSMLERIAANPLDPPDLIHTASAILSTILREAPGTQPLWAQTIRVEDIDAMKDQPLLDRLHDIMERSPERIALYHVTKEIRVNFGGDLAEAGRFEKLIPAQALKNRMVDVVTLDMIALEKEYGFTPKTRRKAWWARLLGLKG